MPAGVQENKHITCRARLEIRCFSLPFFSFSSFFFVVVADNGKGRHCPNWDSRTACGARRQ